MGVYDTTQVPIYKYLHEKGHPDYAVSDDFFQAAFGGSFLNHQWLIAAATPSHSREPRPACIRSIDSERDAGGDHPALRFRPGPVQGETRSDGVFTCPAPAAPRGSCGGLRAVNDDASLATPNPPQGRSGRSIPAQTAPTIGDRLHRRRDRLGLVFRGLVERRWRRPRARDTQSHRSTCRRRHTARPERRSEQP